ncbi:hypothetical protein, partial [Burkholderia sp. L27(2015)]|uniref:hypothetical protein n=1 Tax=Burkholderia sp. L27(2015) TaxID=1641858 RepID=UPI00131EC20B
DDPVAQSHIGNVVSRQYCPVLVTKTGCLISIQAGEICGGQWDKKRDRWKVGVGGDIEADTAAMVNPGFSTAHDLWNEFYKATTSISGRYKLQDALVDNLGIMNLMTCEPPTENNRDSYAAIARQLIKEGDRTDAEYIEKKLGIAVNAGVPSQGLM